MNLQTLQTTFESLPDWEKEIFLNDNVKQLLEDITVPGAKPDLSDVDTEDIAAWLVANNMVTCNELLDAIVDDVEELREIMVESAIYDYENQEEILDEDDYYISDRNNTNNETGGDFPY